MDFAVGRRQFIAQPRVQRETRIYFEGILRITIEVLPAYATREIASSLKEEDRLAYHEAGECIGKWKRREDKKTVCSDTLQHVDALMLIAATKLQFVLAANPVE